MPVNGASEERRVSAQPVRNGTQRKSIHKTIIMIINSEMSDEKKRRDPDFSFSAFETKLLFVFAIILLIVTTSMPYFMMWTKGIFCHFEVP